MPKIALIQQYATPDRAANIKTAIESARRAARAGAELVAFAELGFEVFHPQRAAAPPFPLALAESVPGPTTDRFAALARELEVVIVLNLYERDGQRAYDSSPVIDADGSLLGVTRMLHIAEMPCFHEQSSTTRKRVSESFGRTHSLARRACIVEHTRLRVVLV